MSSKLDFIKSMLLEHFVQDITNIILKYANFCTIEHIYEGKKISDSLYPISDFWIENEVLYTAYENTVNLFNFNTLELMEQHYLNLLSYENIIKIEVSHGTILIISREYSRQYNLFDWKLINIFDNETYEHIYIDSGNVLKLHSLDLTNNCFGINCEQYYFRNMIIRQKTIYALFNRIICKIPNKDVMKQHGIISWLSVYDNIEDVPARDKIITSLFLYNNDLYCRDFKGRCYYVNFMERKLESIHFHGSKSEFNNFKNFADRLFSMNNRNLYEHTVRIT
jgi:hypothetical protein